MNRITRISSKENEDYLLQENDKTVLKLRYKPGSHTVRIEAGNEKRVFIIENEGLIKSKFVFKNEYGVRVGQLDADSWSAKEGIIHMEEMRFRYKIQNTPKAELLIYGSTKTNIIFRCDLFLDDKILLTDNREHSFFITNQLYPLLLSVGWYLFIKTGLKVGVGLSLS